jgi:hypothetical protein
MCSDKFRKLRIATNAPVSTQDENQTTQKDLRNSKKVEVALLALAGLCLLPFVRLAWFAHPYLDDFLFPLIVRRHGIWSHVVTMYLTWQGRFSASLIIALHPLAWGGLSDVKPFTAVFILVVAASILFAGAALLRGERIRWLTRLAAGSIPLTLLLLMLPSPTEAFYWLQSGLSYMGGVICWCLLLGAIAHVHADPKPLARRLWWLLAAGLTLLAPAFSEMASCFVLAGALVLLPAIWRRQLASKWLALLALAVVAATAATFAPGNFVHQRGAHFPFVRSILLANVSLAYTLVSWLSNGMLLVLTLLLLPALQRLVSLPGLALTKLTKWAWRWPVWLGVGLLLCFVFTHLAVGGPPPSRARNLVFVFFIFGWFLSVASLLAHRLRLGKPPLPSLPLYGRAILSGLFLLLLVTDHNFKLWRKQVGTPTNSVAQAYYDWLSGDAAQYDREEEARYALIQRTSAEEVAIPALSRQPVTLFWWDISNNPALWGNQAYAQFFHKRAIWVASPQK